MKPLYTEAEFLKTKSTEKLALQCYTCHRKFYKPKKAISRLLTHGAASGQACKFCSLECSHRKNGPLLHLQCTQCHKNIITTQGKRNKSKNPFCSQSCSATYNNTNKTSGHRRSKLEFWLEQQLQTLYPEFEFHFNRKDSISSELDIYIPSLKLAFELNGIFHYEPIYGADKLTQITNNDNRKFQACLENGIELCIIDTSRQKRFTEKSSMVFLDIINNIIYKAVTRN